MKKETLEEAKHNCEGCQGKGYLDETDGYIFGKAVCPVCVNDKEPKQDHFQEMNDFMIKGTLEEAAENYGWRIKRNSFSDKVKANELAESAQQDFIAGAKWQAERMYSDEEVSELVYNIIGEYGKHYGIMIDGAKLNELFEQFKKK